MMTDPTTVMETNGRDGFRHLVRAEWTKFRTVRGWVAGMAVGVALVVALGLMSAAGTTPPAAWAMSRPPARSRPGRVARR
ncbi:hypothetical protein OHB01_23140 [Microbispora hainanensis]|uniref:hypothetical protein n=1 Tax=Microbispora TaxID=2005 RepID=UPI0021C81DA4|nr:MULTISPECIES: hypothetical protein [Microbispora]